MKMVIGCLAVLTLGACDKPQEEAQPPEPVATAPPPPDPWPGKYEGDVMVNVTGPVGAYRVWLLAAKADGCTGDLGLADKGLPARVAGDGLDVVVPAKADAERCTVHLVRRGATVTVTEDSGCASYHGATCGFAGTAHRVN